jgi:hypothetical protein
VSPQAPHLQTRRLLETEVQIAAQLRHFPTHLQIRRLAKFLLSQAERVIPGHCRVSFFRLADATADL